MSRSYVFLRRAVAVAAVCFLGVWAVGQTEPGAVPKSDAKPTGDVAAFGAVGDGVADDTAAVRRAVESGVGAVRFPKGTYRLTQTVAIDLDRVGLTTLVGDGVATVLMAGPGPAFKFVGTHEGTAAPDSVKPNVWERQRTPGIDGLEIVGGHPQAVGVEATGTMQLTLTRLVVRKALHAVHLTGRNRNVILSACHLYENRGVGVYYDHVNLHQSNIVGCHVSYNAGGGIVCRGGDVRNIQVSGCDVEGNHAADGPPTANVLIDSSGGVNGVGEVAIVGCTIQHTHFAPDSANVRILGLSDGGDRAAVGKDQPLGGPVREGNVTIADNVFSDVDVNVHLRDCRGVTVVGNTFWMAFDRDLLVEDCASVVVGPNAFDRNPRYAYSDSRDARNGVLFRDCADCTLTGLHLHGVERQDAALALERCRRFNVTGCTVLDSDGVGLLLSGVTASRVSDCLIRDDRPGREGAVSLRIVGGGGNLVEGNLLGGTQEVAEKDGPPAP